MVFPSSSHYVFSLFDTAYTLSMRSMKRAFPIIDRDCKQSMGSMEYIIAVKGKDAHCEGWVFSGQFPDWLGVEEIRIYAFGILERKYCAKLTF